MAFPLHIVTFVWIIIVCAEYSLRKASNIFHLRPRLAVTSKVAGQFNVGIFFFFFSPATSFFPSLNPSIQRLICVSHEVKYPTLFLMSCEFCTSCLICKVLLHSMMYSA